MHTDKETATQGAEGIVETDESTEETALRWLLDMDLSEQEERLFAVDDGGYVDQGLTDYETKVAARPMIRGRADADDLSTYVAEEIVISSESQGSDIYAREGAVEERADSASDARFNEPMAIDWSQRRPATTSGPAPTLADGADVLGLVEEDDIGERHLVLKRVKAEELRLATDGLSGEQQGDAVPLAVDALPEAPLVSQAATPEVSGAAHQNASDEGDAGADNAGQRDGSVSDYVARVSPPAGDEAFDEYLLRGEQLQDDAAAIDELVVEPVGGVEPVDPSTDATIDYPADLTAMAGFEREAAADVATVIAQVMDEIANAVAQRLTALGVPGEPVQAEVMLGSDPDAVEQWVADGYEPVVSLCDRPPAGLQALRQTDVDSIHVRLVHGATGDNWNGLFAEGFVPPASGGVNEAAAVVEYDRGASVDDPELPVVDDVVGVEALAAPEPAAPEPAAPELAAPDHAGFDQVDIDDAFSDLGEGLEDADPNAEMFARFEEAAEHEPAAMQVFDEDIFAGDFAGELEATAGVAADDIEAMFEDLGKGDDNSDEICGVHVDEFDRAAPVPQAAPEAVVDEVSEPAPGAAEVVADGAWCIPEGIVFNYASKSGTELFADFLDAFIEEGSSELEKLEDAIGAWESDVASESAFTVVARTLHTIKGIAKGVGLQYYGTLIHNYETLLEALPRPEPGAEADYFRIVNAWLDAAVRGMDYVSSHRADIVSEFPQQGGMAAEGAAVAEAVATAEPVQEHAAGAVNGQVAAAPAQPRDARRRQLDKQLADEGAKVLAAQQSVRITSEKLDHLLNLSNQAQQLGVRTAQSTTRSKRTSAEMQARLSSVRAHIANIADRTLISAGARGEKRPEELDALEMDQYSELQEAANILREGVEDLIDLVELASRQNAQVEALLKQQATVIASIGSSIRAARVVPVSRLMPGLRRIVRTVSSDLDKTVSFKVRNEVGTLDRDDYARCQIILEHMVRNALDHGIESREEREIAGKSAAGQITIDVRKSGADQIITLSDDGRGIDPEAMRESALKKGLDVDVDALTDDEAIRLIFHKGFSTASTVSQISGRGVGMDIVLSELQEMGGDIQIDSAVGRGTSFRIRIPSNVAVNGALLVTAGDSSYAIPLGGLISVEHVPVGDFFAAVEQGTPLSLSGMTCEPAYLGTLCQGESLPERKAWGASVPVIIAGSPERYMAIAIDDVEEALELVIRSLGAQFATVPGLAGAATTADGEAVVALDLNLLIADVANSNQMQLSISKEKADSLLALVVDDSRTQRMVTTSQLETVGVETVTAENGGVAIDLLNTAERLPDVILLDVEMPVKDGIQTLREIRKSVRYGHVPVIMVTSRTGLKHRSLAQEAGCNGYMGKPFNFRMLVGQINELTGHRLQLA